VEVEEVPALALKGKAGDVRAFRLLSVNSQAPARASRRDSPMVGRDAELAQVRSEFESTLTAAACRLVTVVGPAGIGKTRLVEEFTNSLGARATVLTGRCLSYGQGVTFWAVTDVVRQAADIGPTDEEAQAKFGFLLEALRLGAPPHGGIARGMDRVAMLLSGAESLRDVIPFPKTQKGTDLMTDAPNTVSPAQLAELKIRVADTQAVGTLLRNCIGAIPTVRSTRTTVVLQTVKETGNIPVANGSPGSTEAA